MKKYYRQYKEANAEKSEVTEQEVLEKLSGPYLDAELALEGLQISGVINTPFATYYYE